MLKTSSKRTDRDQQCDRFLKEQGYRLGGILGEGSYSKVRVADRDGQRLAIKIISKQFATKEYLHRFLPRELSLLRNLSHPNICTIYEILDFDLRVFIFMELAEKGDLLDYIKIHHYIQESEAKIFFSQLARAIQYIHELQISHRDLKCENILITQNKTIKLTDFGFGRKCVDRMTGKRILSDTYCGSTAYAAPEVIQGVPYNPKMYDIWSMGCVLFIMVTGTMPFDDSNLRKMLRYQREKRFWYPPPFDARISDECKALIRSMMEPDVIVRTTINKIMKNPWIQHADIL